MWRGSHYLVNDSLHLLSCHVCTKLHGLAEEFVNGHTLCIARWIRELDRASFVFHFSSAKKCRIALSLNTETNLSEERIAAMQAREQCLIPQVEHLAPSFWKLWEHAFTPSQPQWNNRHSHRQHSATRQVRLKNTPQQTASGKSGRGSTRAQPNWPYPVESPRMCRHW